MKLGNRSAQSTLRHREIKSMSPSFVYYNWIITNAQKKRHSFTV